MGAKSFGEIAYDSKAYFIAIKHGKLRRKDDEDEKRTNRSF